MVTDADWFRQVFRQIGDAQAAIMRVEDEFEIELATQEIRRDLDEDGMKTLRELADLAGEAKDTMAQVREKVKDLPSPA